ncbi:hypothetical protein PHMEG_00032919 [Phytophthora megakarya]|uniref:Uncharacterized protein n=1 Tax=Phytophthora megakarya TaxID=4795 RepID=A0A225UVG5_9STRA|nr:hypothetical protein PHMEG_00032919 [Phytophthora megakarya]
MKIVSDAGYENYLVRREDKNGELREFKAHISFLPTYHEPTDELQKTAEDVELLEQQANDDVNEQLRVRKIGKTMVSYWRRLADGNDEIKTDTTYSSTSYALHEVYSTDTMYTLMQRMTTPDGYRSRSTADCMMRAESGTTLTVEKACNEGDVQDGFRAVFDVTNRRRVREPNGRLKTAQDEDRVREGRHENVGDDLKGREGG